MDLKYKTIEFIFTHHKHIFQLSLEYLLKDRTNSLHTKIKEECAKLNIILYEENIILYDIENNVKINKYDDLVDYNTYKCKIIIVPINLD